MFQIHSAEDALAGQMKDLGDKRERVTVRFQQLVESSRVKTDPAGQLLARCRVFFQCYQQRKIPLAASRRIDDLSVVNPLLNLCVDDGLNGVSNRVLKAIDRNVIARVELDDSFR